MADSLLPSTSFEFLGICWILTPFAAIAAEDIPAAASPMAMLYVFFITPTSLNK
jgi:hypothetical protein